MEGHELPEVEAYRDRGQNPKCDALGDNLAPTSLADAAINALEDKIDPLYRLLQAERALEDPDVIEGTTHVQTDAHIEEREAYRAACAAFGLDDFMDDDDA